MGAYRPLWRARRPGGRPLVAPAYRVLVHRQYADKWLELADRVGEDAAQRFWDHVAMTPGTMPATAGSCILKGSAGRPQSAGWSRTVHYEVSSMGRINYQYCDSYQTAPDADLHKVVAILTIDYSSH
jgi:hypothetical protein